MNSLRVFALVFSLNVLRAVVACDPHGPQAQHEVQLVTDTNGDVEDVA